MSTLLKSPPLYQKDRLIAKNIALIMQTTSGSTVASEADIRLTERLKSALELIDVRVLDHMIVARGQVLSFAEQGLLT